jgi:hypothetical protein
LGPPAPRICFFFKVFLLAYVNCGGEWGFIVKILNMSSIHPPPAQRTYFTDLSFIFNSKVSAQGGFSVYLSCENTVLWSILSPFLLSLLSLLFNSFQYLSLCHLPAQISILLTIILFSFPSSPDFHRLVPLFQSSSIYECVYDPVCFVYMFSSWIYLPHMRENMQPFSF